MRALPLLTAYRLASAGLGLAAPLYLLWRGKTGHDDVSRRNERLGRAQLARPDGPLALLQVERGGEAVHLAPLAEKLGQLRFAVLLSIRDFEPGGLRFPRLPRCLRQFSPLDAPPFVATFLEHWRPDILLILGPKIAPNLVIEASVRKIPIALVNASFSARSFSIWHKFPGFAASLLRRIDVCLTRTEADAEGFDELGIRNVQVTGDLKYDLLPQPADQPALARLLARIGKRPTWVASGTVAGEEETVFAAHCLLARDCPGLLTIVVPHNPKRAFDVAGIAARLGLRAEFWSADPTTSPLPDICIGHKTAAAGLFYRAAGIVFAGKSLGGSGKNPAEAARLGCAILHGPDVEEFEGIYQALDEAGGGALVFDAQSLAKRLARLFFDRSELRAMGRAAAATAEAFGGASERIIDAIAPYLTQGMVSAWPRAAESRGQA